MRVTVVTTLFIFCICFLCTVISAEEVPYQDFGYRNDSSQNILSLEEVIHLHEIENQTLSSENRSKSDFNRKELILEHDDMGIASIESPVSSGNILPNITSYLPDNGQNNHPSIGVIIRGSHFQQGVSANLTNLTYRQKNVTPTTFVHSGEYIASFDLRGISPGQYWIEAKNPGGIESPKHFNLTWGNIPKILNYPGGVALDGSGNIYVANTDSNQIKKFNSDGTFLTSWGSYGTGTSQFMYPYDICLDNSGNVYVSDTGNSRIQKFSSNGTYLTTWGSYGAGPGQFKSPRGIYVNNTGIVFVTDMSNNRVQKFSSDGTYLASWGSYGEEAGQFHHPNGISGDPSGNITVVDTYNQRIQKFTSDGSFLTKWGVYGTGIGQFSNPWGICTDSNGNIYVTDVNNHRIQKFSSEGTFLTKWGSYGSGLMEFRYPMAICADNAGYVYITDTENNRIQKFSSIGVFVSTLIQNDPSQLSEPKSACTDRSGYVYVADYYRDRIVKFSADGTYLTEWGSSGSGPGQLSNVWGVTADNAGNIYVADHGNHRIQKFSSNGTYLTKWGNFGTGPGNFSWLEGIGTDRYNNVYVSDGNNDCIQKFSSNGEFLGMWGSSGSGPGQFHSPFALCVDSIGNVYVADSGNRRVQKFTSGGVYITSWGSSGSGPGQFSWAYGIGTDDAGNVYVGDTGNDRVQKFSADGTYLTEWGSFGSGPGQFSNIEDVSADNSGNIYVTDPSYNRIQKFSDVPFMVTPAVSPVVTGMYPDSGYAASTVSCNLTGSNFASGALVNLTKPGQVNITATGTLSGQNLTGSFILPADTPTGIWNVQVNQFGYYSNNNTNFTVLAPLPVITDLNPGGSVQNTHTEPFSVIITGNYFNTVATTGGVIVDGSAVQYTIDSSTQINATFPATIDDTSGDHPVVVMGESGLSGIFPFVVATDGFTIHATSDRLGWIEPSGLIIVNPGSSVSFSFKPSAGAVMKNLTVNGAEVLPIPESSYSIDNINKNYEVRLNNDPIPGLVIASFTASPMEGNAVMFTDISWGSPTSREWDFGDGSKSSEKTVIHTYTNPGTYTVTLWARNDLSQSTSVLGGITVPLSSVLVSLVPL